jgi:hypothetical protein
MSIVALYEYQGATEEELCFSAGDKFIIVNKENEDWWFVRNDEQMEGYVPSTYFKQGGGSVSESNSEESESQESFSEEEVESEAESETKKISEEGDEFDSEEEKEVSEVLRSVREKKRPRTPLTGVGVKLLPPEPLEGFSQMPIGYRRSTLFENYNKGIGRTPDWLIPEVGTSAIDFKHLFLDTKGHVRKIQVLNISLVKTPCTIAFSILDAKSIASPPLTLNVIGRHVRLALFDRTNIKSNIVLLCLIQHHIPAILVPNSNVWTFSTKVFIFIITGITSISKRFAEIMSDDENTCFLRATQIDIKLCLLFEMCMTVLKSNPANPDGSSL